MHAHALPGETLPVAAVRARSPRPRPARAAGARAARFPLTLHLLVTCSFALVTVLARPVAHADRRRDADRTSDGDRRSHEDQHDRDRRDDRDAADRVAHDRDDDDVEVELDVDHYATDVAASAIVGSSRPPLVAEVLEAAYEAAGLDRDPTKSWMRRARVAALLPWVTVRTGWDANWHDDEPDVGRSRTFEVRATWRLDRLLFDGRELQVASADAVRRRERRRLANQVIRSYFAWRKVTALATRDPRFGLAAEAATAQLDALTDGWFSERWKSGT